MYTTVHKHNQHTYNKFSTLKQNDIRHNNAPRDSRDILKEGVGVAIYDQNIFETIYHK